jgi:5,6-dimethylbenzimidazole synthase
MVVQAPAFDDQFRAQFRELLAWRRDVRRFKTRPPDPRIIAELLDLACLAPSVGNSQPWRFVLVEDLCRRALVVEDFRRCNDAALSMYSGELASRYARLKLAGLQEAPCHLAVFADDTTAAGRGLGRQTMPATLHYSAVVAVHTLWLAARAHGLGVGWVSILSPAEIARVLTVPESWTLIAYLCVGYPEEEHLDPELERQQWQERYDISTFVLYR